MIKSQSKWISYLVIALLAVLHLPFLHADPDRFLSVGRDAFTDEGLNTTQIRNYVNHGYIDLNECDNMIKSPLFNIILYLPLKFFGTHLIVARLTVLIVLLVALLSLTRNQYLNSLIPILTIIAFTQYYVFQYSHFSLSEMMAVICILLGIVFLYKFYEREERKFLFLSALMLSFSYYLKIQFAYIIALLPLAIAVLHILKIHPQKKISSLFLVSVGWLMLCAVLYLLLWYLPSKASFNYIISDQVSGKFKPLPYIPGTFVFNAIHFAFSEKTWWFNTLAGLCFILGIMLFGKTIDRNFKVLFVLSSLWMIIESYKFGMVYLPSRYLVSYYFAAGMMMSVVIHQLISLGKDRRFFYGVGIAILILVFAANTIHYSLLLSRREYRIQEINRYFLTAMKSKEAPVMGAWSPTATWDCKARSLGVWKNFMNDKDLFNRFHPQAILSEPDEAESNQAYSSQGIDLSVVADSTRKFEIGNWEVIVYWVK